MSIEAMNWAGHIKVGSSAAKAVLGWLANLAGAEDGFCWPSIDYLVARTELNRKTVIKCLDDLIVKGLIEDTGNRRGRTKQVIVYRLCFEKTQQGELFVSTEAAVAAGETVPKTEQFQKRNSSDNSGKSPNFSGKSPNFGTRNSKNTQEQSLHSAGAREDDGEQGGSTDPPMLGGIPPDWQPSDMDREFARMSTMPRWGDEEIEYHAQQFRDHYLAKPARVADWSAMWRKWVGRSGYIQGRASHSPAARGDTAHPARLAAAKIAAGLR